MSTSPLGFLGLLCLLSLGGCGGDSSASADAGNAPSDAALGPDAGPPIAPEGLEYWITGNPEDAPIIPSGPGLFLAGGGTDQNAGFAWAQSKAPGGDLVVLRTSGSDGYNDYIYSEIGGFDSVETLKVTTRSFADDPYIRWSLDHAEVIFMAGGDQWTYLDNWRDTEVQSALARAYQRGAVLGGTSAGCAVLGEFLFSAENDTVYSSEALADPYNQFMTLERDFQVLAPMRGIITDTHFGARDRMGRLAGFLARIMQDGLHGAPIGLGIDEATALLVEADGSAEVIGSGAVYLVSPTEVPGQCSAGQALSFENISYRKLVAGDTVTLPAGTSAVAPEILNISEGLLSPADPY